MPVKRLIVPPTKVGKKTRISSNRENILSEGKLTEKSEFVEKVHLFLLPQLFVSGIGHLHKYHGQVVFDPFLAQLYRIRFV